jgi:FkbM family methyltransferase
MSGEQKLKSVKIHNRYVGDIHLYYHPFDVYFNAEFELKYYRDERMLNIVNFMYDIDTNIRQKPCDIIDIGTHIGTHTILYSKLMKNNGVKGKVYSFEPQSKCREILNLNLKKNGCDNVVVVDLLVGDKERVCKFPKNTFDVIGNEGERKVMTDGDKEHTELIDKQMTTIDQFCAEYNIRPKLIKVDIESFDLPALYGGCETIKKYKPYIIYEHAERLESDLQTAYEIPDSVRDFDIVGFCKSVGYNPFVYRFPVHNTLIVPCTVNPTIVRFNKGTWRDLYSHVSFEMYRTMDAKRVVKETQHEIEMLRFLDNNMVYYESNDRKQQMIGKFGSDGNVIRWCYPNEEMWINDKYWKKLTNY